MTNIFQIFSKRFWIFKHISSSKNLNKGYFFQYSKYFSKVFLWDFLLWLVNGFSINLQHQRYCLLWFFFPYFSPPQKFITTWTKYDRLTHTLKFLKLRIAIFQNFLPIDKHCYILEKQPKKVRVSNTS